MEPIQQLIPSRAPRVRSRRGAALLMVLSALVLITVLTLAFFGSVTTEYQTSKSYAAQTGVRQLADSSVQLVMAQIRDATSSSSGNRTWASQPGMIRSYDTTGKMATAYKLYSDPQLVVTGGAYDPTSDWAPSNWVSQPALWTDLNAPISSNGASLYPIFDPAAAQVVSNGNTLVDGCTINSSASPVAASGNNNTAAMPVRWLYVLKDGTIAPATVSGAAVNVTGANSTDKEIVGRIAFWTDDESCKLNVNTASEGSYWDVPSFCTPLDVAFSQYQPAAREYQRYLGHPATTCLSPVFWSYFNLQNPGGTLNPVPGTAGYDTTADAAPQIPSYASDYLQTLFSMSPRIIWGGSQSGTVTTLGGAASVAAANLDSDRLYASVDEFFLSNSYSGTQRKANAFDPNNNLRLGAQDLAKLRFFLTANSRTPETNPLGLPKVTIWPEPFTTGANPVNASYNIRSPLDQLIAFCSTINGYAYYFSRYDPTSPTNDYTSIKRNQEVYAYLRNCLKKVVPGFKVAFEDPSKWNTLQADQIVTNIFDYIRSCINLVDSSNGTTASPNFARSYTKPPVLTTAGSPPVTTSTLNYGTGQVVPINITTPASNATKGIGRFPTIRGATLQFIARGADQPPLQVYTSGNFVRCPVLYDPTTTTSWDGSGSAIPTATLLLLMQGKIQAPINYMHPWTCPNANSFVPQLIVSGKPVMAVDSAKLAINPNDASAVYPVFDLSGTNTSGTPPTRTYPTLDGNNNFYTTAAPTGGALSTILIGGNPYQYYKAINTSLQQPGYTAQTAASAPQTHAGLPYLTTQRATGTSATGNKQGAFDITNINFLDVTPPAANNNYPPLQPYQTRIETILILDPVCVAAGNVGVQLDCQFEVQGLSQFKAGGTALGFPATGNQVIQNGPGGGGRPNPWMPYFLYGIGWQSTLSYRYTRNPTQPYASLPFFSKPTPASDIVLTNSTFAFNGGDITVNIKVPSPGTTTVQSLTLNFPDATFPTPKLVPWSKSSTFLDYPPTNTKAGAPGANTGSDLVTLSWLTFDRLDARSGGASRLTPGGAGFDFRTLIYLLSPEVNCSGLASDPSYSWWVKGLNRITADTFRSVEALYGDLRMISSLSTVPKTFFTPNPFYSDSIQYDIGGWKTYQRSGHSLRSADSSAAGAQFSALTDTTLIDTANPTNPVNYPDSSRRPPYIVGQSYQMQIVGGITATPPIRGNFLSLDLPRGINGYAGTGGHIEFPYTTPSMDFTDTTNFLPIWQAGGDFDNGLGMFADGPFINKADEGPGQVGGTFLTNPYFSAAYYPTGSTLFSPNRQVPSPVILGSLPVGFSQAGSLGSPSPNLLKDSWKTLLFSPNPNSSTSVLRDTRTALNGMTEAGQVPVGDKIPDHLLLDFLHMPVVEPYAISEPLSTAGKVNMNYQIVPFNYIKRDTAMRGVLKSVMITAVDDQFINNYKMRSPADNTATFSDSKYPPTYTGGYNQFGANSGNHYFRYPIHLTETLKQWDARFTKGDLFRFPSEVCSLWLYPGTQALQSDLTKPATALVSWDASGTAIKKWWYGTGPGDINRKSLTGDNLRERPYASIYPRLTTKSNTYTVHYRVQLLKKIKNTDATQWVEGADQVLSEFQGSSLIERYIESSDRTLPDFATLTTASSTPSMDAYYKFRVISTKKFSP